MSQAAPECEGKSSFFPPLKEFWVFSWQPSTRNKPFLCVALTLTSQRGRQSKMKIKEGKVYVSVWKELIIQPAPPTKREEEVVPSRFRVAVTCCSVEDGSKHSDRGRKKNKKIKTLFSTNKAKKTHTVSMQTCGASLQKPFLARLLLSIASTSEDGARV